MSIPSRKRAAPGAVPVSKQNIMAYDGLPSHPQNQSIPSEDYAADWAQPGAYTDPINSYPNLGAYDATGLTYPVAGTENQYSEFPDPQMSGQLVRRNVNNQVARKSDLPWEIEEQRDEDDWIAEAEDEALLDRRAQEAKREALSKKRQIPPFVQKISSFLEESRNTELIRWSDDGRSFIVLDEDEFAKTLIPELFKHNNYASFVRQLNMYGFHKKVGLADNSMKASENKRKTPSEYYNPYFQKGQPDLLWLIQKPKVAPTTKGAESKAEEEEEISAKKKGNALTQVRRKAGSDSSSKDLVAVSSNDLDKMRQEIIGLKRQNGVISDVITNMKKQNTVIHQQAVQFQQAQERFQMMHERHENSINAILTFLATFYNRSLEGQGGQNIANMFAATMQGANNQSGNIVDMTDMPDMPDMDIGMHNMNNRSNTPRQRRTQLLLPAPDISSASTPQPRIEKVETPPFQAFDTCNPNTPNDMSNDILSLINAANTNSPQTGQSNTLDFKSALEHMQTADGNTPLTDAQRSDVLQRMTQDANTSMNADISPNIRPISSTALTPVASPPMSMPSPNLEKILNQQTSLDYVQKLQEEQAKRVQTLADRLGPLSPNGLVPGLHDKSSPVPENWSLDDWLNNTEYFPDASGVNGFDPNLTDPLAEDGEMFSEQPTGNGVAGAFGESPTTPTVEEVADPELNMSTSAPSRKRQRQS